MEITVSFPGGKKVDATVRGQLVRTDQPRSSGGDGSAPSPYDLFLASLATCAGFYVLSFLQSRNLPVEGVGLRQLHEFDPVTHALKRVSLLIELPPDVPEKYHGAIVRAASQCAVKRALESPPELEVRTVPAG